MPAPTTSQDRARLTILAAGTQAILAAEMVADQLQMTRSEAAARILRGPGVLADHLDRQIAGRIAAMLRVMGVRTRVDRSDCPVETVERFDIVLQEMPCGAGPGVIVDLAGILGREDKDIIRDLATPTGLRIAGQDWEKVSLWRRAMPRLAGLRMVISNPETARYDLMPLGQPRDSAERSRLRRDLARLGLGSCALTGAVACDVDRAQCDHLMRRNSAAGVVAINRDFQRYDVLLTGCHGLTRAEMADFLCARTSLPRAVIVRPEAGVPLVIERGLTRSQAVSFHAEYAAIGLRTRLRLVGADPCTQPAGIGQVRRSP